ncbi:MAG: PEP/pyruvate-binding domain-containing protein [Bacilli bacterium]|jgi:pyruvate,water dikinase|nr:PEP/pyruvate-binding domain-containing protein [Bacilli bacterium]
MKIAWLDNIPSDDLGNVGGKAKGLFLLNSLGLEVAPGFVAYGISTPEDELEMFEYWKSSTLGEVAVRSSATLEDGVDLSQAGQYETFTCIDSDEKFISAVKGCIKSLNQVNASKYRHFFNQGQSTMNIVVQKMVKAKSAGVLFTINPTTRENDVRIEVVAGLGENLVSGKMKSQTILINRQKPSFGVISTLLSEKNLKQLYKDGLKAEEAMLVPADLEFAIDENSHVIWLQARPITTLDDPTIDELNTAFPVEGDVITNHNVGEMLPGAITPLTISTIVYAIDYGLRKMLTDVGVAKKIEDIPAELLISHYYGHLFFNMRHLYRITKAVTGATKQNIDVGICGQTLDYEQPDDFKKPNGFIRLRNGLRYGKFMSGYKKAMKEIALIADQINISGNTINELYDSISNNLDLLNQALLDHYVTSVYSGAMNSALFYILANDNDNHDEVKGRIASVLEDIDDIESADIIKSLSAIAEEIIRNEPLAEDFDAQVLKDYLKIAPARVIDLKDLFMQRHGHRCIRESELRSPGWKDDEDGFILHLLTLVKSVASYRQKEKKIGPDNVEVFLSDFYGLKRFFLRIFVNGSRKGCRIREFSKSKMILAVDKFKSGYRLLAKMLVEQGALPEVDLIYFLTHQELGEMIVSKDPKYVKKAFIRKRLLPEQERLKFAHVNIGAPKPTSSTFDFAIKGAKLSGTPLSRGQVIGRARIITSVEDAKKLQKGEIMVAGYTDIGWSPYYALIAGLVTEVGSALSHGAVVAREYALPLVSNVQNATEIIRDGDIISIDGASGTVVIIDS